MSATCRLALQIVAFSAIPALYGKARKMSKGYCFLISFGSLQRIPPIPDQYCRTLAAKIQRIPGRPLCPLFKRFFGPHRACGGEMPDVSVDASSVNHGRGSEGAFMPDQVRERDVPLFCSASHVSLAIKPRRKASAIRSA